MGPDVNDLVVSFVVGDETHIVVLHHFCYLLFGAIHQLDLFIGNDDVIQVERKSSFKCIVETEVLNVIQKLSSSRNVGRIQDMLNYTTQ